MRFLKNYTHYEEKIREVAASKEPSLNTKAIGLNPDINYLATILAHEMGFRHTDYFDRSLSGCPYAPDFRMDITREITA